MKAPADIPLRDLATRIVHRLQDAGFAAFWVGGCVRDFLLGREPGDYDIATSALPDQIEKLFKRTIAVGRKFGVMIFSGLADKTAYSIKSCEAVDRVWVEEAQAVSEKSWRILTPTIRAPGSEIWISFNPELDTDPVYQRFVLNPPDSSRVVKINYDDNPWFTPELELERAHSEKGDPDEYRNVWLGECRAAVEGAIFAKEVTAAQEAGRFCNVPYDPMLKAHVVCDLGFNDSMAIILVQRNASELRVFDSSRTRNARWTRTARN